MKKPGDEILCPYCSQSSFLVKKTIMDGWIKKGEELVCSSCSAQMYEFNSKKEELSKPLLNEKLKELNSFLSLDENDITKPAIISNESDQHFCRDCIHLISHPFLTRCSLLKKDVNPMGDCPEFSSKQK